MMEHGRTLRKLGWWVATSSLGALHAALARAAAGRPTAVVVAGELGVGKTRLVREFLAAGRRRGLRGRLGARRR